MLVHHPSTRQHHHQFNNHSNSPQPTSQQPSQLALLHNYFSSASSSSQLAHRRAQSEYSESSAFESPSGTQSLDDHQYMSNSYNYSNPAIRVQQSTPTPGLQSSAANTSNQQSLPFVESNAYSHLWDTYGGNGNMVATSSLHGPGMTRSRSHQRAPSTSSIGSSGSASPFSQGHATSYSYAGSVQSPTMNTASKLNQNYNADQSSSSGFSNHLPTPTQTPTQDSFMVSSYPNYNQQGNIEPAVAAHFAMNHAIDTSHNEEDLPGMSHSGRQSISSLGQEPSTPRTVPDHNEEYKYPIHGENSFPAVEAWIDEYLRGDDVADTTRHQNFPKLDRTVSDAYQDELYNPVMMAASIPSSSKLPKQFLSPHRNIITERLQAAQIARSQSPTSANSRGVSPFRPDSPWAHDQFRTGGRFGTASQVRQQQKAKADAAELSQHMQHEDSQPKTISPKDAILEYNETDEDSKMPLFPQDNNTGFGQQFGDGQQQQDYQQVASGQNFSIDASRWTNQNRPSAQTFSNTPISSSQPQQQISGYNFASPAIPGNMSNMPFSSQNYRSTAMASSLKQEDTPDFPAQLTSMDSSASEAPPSSNPKNNEKSQKPTSSLADTGTYTCTYHGCTLRFETPQKLQKHKREGHRNPSTSAASSTQAPPTSPNVGSGMTSAAIMQRNSQAGPHKCERINPTTGKPCNTIFSRPYDLTRHEDTIHNVRKQKVRCALCVEEKTFSRNDALTRHMRVVHPEVDFPGKHRRRGTHDS